MKRRTVLLLILAALLIEISSCASTPVSGTGDVPYTLEYLLREIDKAFLSADPATALLLINNSTEEDMAEALSGYRTRGEKLLNDLYLKSRIEQDYLKAYSYSRTASAAGYRLQPEGMERKDYLLSAAEKQRQAGNMIPALVLFEEALESGVTDPSFLTRYAELAAAEQWFSTLERILETMKAQGMDIQDTYTEMVRKREGPAIKLSGMATVWVNRGIRIEGGVGLPDQVIGSGFFIDQRGYLLTNYHVIATEVDPKYEGFSRLFIRLPGSMQVRIPARVVGYDPVFDIALLKAELTPPNLFSLSRGSLIAPGVQIYAIGSPLGLESTVTSGIISATGRRLLPLGDTIQVDVPINQGNSGGPLFDREGKIVGIVFAGIEQFEGINFAIPAEWFIPLLPDLYRGGQVEHSWLGFAMNETTGGLEIMYRMPGDLRRRTGLEMGDIITEIDGIPVSTLRDAQRIVLGISVGTLARITYSREGKSATTLVMVEKRPDNPILQALETDSRDNVLVPLFGMALSPAGYGTSKRTYSVRRIFAGTIADEIGLSENDPMTILNWLVDEEEGYVAIQIHVKKRKAGFIETAVQLAAYLNADYFI